MQTGTNEKRGSAITPALIIEFAIVALMIIVTAVFVYLLR